MRALRTHAFDATTCRRELNELTALLKSKAVLKEAQDILPFFKQRDNLSMLMSWYFPDLKNMDALEHEYQIYGDFRADLVIGDTTTRNYVLVEFEDATPNSVFKPKAGKASRGAPAWAHRFEGAFSQLVDWMWKLDDMRSTSDFARAFGNRDARFHGLIVIGKNMSLAPQESDRLRWRTERVVVDSRKVSCVAFEDLAVDCDSWLTRFHGV